MILIGSRKTPYAVPTRKPQREMIDLIESVRKGGRFRWRKPFEVVSQGLPTGLGEPVFNKLDADLARSLMSIGGIRGFEVGMGFGVVERKGSQVNDLMYKKEDGTLGLQNEQLGRPSGRNNKRGRIWS